MADGKDFLEEMIDVWTEKDPSFRATFEAAWEQREERHKKPSDDLDTFIAERTAKNPVISST
ncbi:MAG TPA: hypothetical protein VFU69_01195, partial [Ktedonobacterales bacterium]|nr:hypothetical protein [Ktedonobacterales bacterium]